MKAPSVAYVRAHIRASLLRPMFLVVGDGPVAATEAAAVACYGALLGRIVPAQAALAANLQPAGDLNASSATRLHLEHFQIRRNRLDGSGARQNSIARARVLALVRLGPPALQRP